MNSKALKQFEATFQSLWSTAKSKGLSESDAEKELNLYRKQK